MLNRLREFLLALLPGSSRGSKIRNFASYGTFFLGLVTLVQIFFDDANLYNLISAILLVIYAFAFFGIVFVSVIFLISEDFQLNPVRLVRDIAISLFYTIVSFAYLYKQLGIADSAHSPLEVFEGAPITYLYFSAVTFSTLGFGDFRPMPEARIPAAIEALFGNLHLGIIAGAVFYIISRLSQKKSR